MPEIRKTGKAKAENHVFLPKLRIQKLHGRLCLMIYEHVNNNDRAVHICLVFNFCLYNVSFYNKTVINAGKTLCNTNAQR